MLADGQEGENATCLVVPSTGHSVDPSDAPSSSPLRLPRTAVAVDGGRFPWGIDGKERFLELRGDVVGDSFLMRATNSQKRFSVVHGFSLEMLLLMGEILCYLYAVTVTISNICILLSTSFTVPPPPLLMRTTVRAGACRTKTALINMILEDV